MIHLRFLGGISAFLVNSVQFASMVDKLVLMVPYFWTLVDFQTLHISTVEHASE